jgi:hypothetical protein
MSSYWKVISSTSAFFVPNKNDEYMTHLDTLQAHVLEEQYFKKNLAIHLLNNFMSFC